MSKSIEKYTLISYSNNYFEILVNKTNEKRISNLDWMEYQLYGFRDLKKLETEYERQAVSRAKQKLKEYCFNNDFEFFVTLTVNSLYANRYSLESCQKKLKSIFKDLKRKFKDFKYVIITEEHKKGAFHFHGLIKGIPINHIYINKNGFLYLEEFNKLGFNSLFPFDNDIKFVNYIIKYISKNPIRNNANYLYFASRGLKVSDRFELSPMSIDKFPHFYENDYIKKCGFYLNELNRVNKIDLFYHTKDVDNKIF